MKKQDKIEIVDENENSRERCNAIAIENKSQSSSIFYNDYL